MKKGIVIFVVLLFSGCFLKQGPTRTNSNNTVKPDSMITRNESNQEIKTYNVEETGNISIKVDESFEVESMSVPVRPPHLMLEPFIELPASITMVEKIVPEEEGVHYVRYRLVCREKGTGAIMIGFKNIETGKVTHQKKITFTTN